MLEAELTSRVQSWIAEDPDPETRRELESLLQQQAKADLAERFSGKLEFGTAGLRGVIGGGPMRMNLAVVRRTSAGLASYLKATLPDAAKRGVVIGYDGRRMSREFAKDAAEVFAGAGLPVHFFEDYAPTPLTAFAVTRTGAAAGVMVTASHNPPEYNGYKVYWENGAQIIPPHDQGISAAIERVGALGAVPRMPIEEARQKKLVRSLGRDMEAQYLSAIRALGVHPEAARDLSIVYTPMHGVGGRLAKAALAQSGFTKVYLVERQFEPDGRFPTVRFPNPEEKGAMDLSMALAAERDADLVLANDPDADRLAVAVKNGKGGYLQLSGDQVGALLGYYLLTEKKGGRERLVMTTIVSSSLLSRMARELEVRYDETLTGFKWIANRAMALEAHGAKFVMGYEEALGYTVGDVVRDKDGISAAAVFAELAAFCRANHKTVLGYLEEIYRRFGLYRSLQHSVTLPGSTGAAQIKQLMERLRASPPAAIGGMPVAATRDLKRSVKTSAKGEEPVDLPKSDVLAFDLEGARVIARPSGTEPKIKYYFELREQMAPNETLEAAQARADGRIKAMLADFLKIVG